MHLLVDISAHGLGHLAQTAPVIEALQARVPELQLTIRSTVPRLRLQQRIAAGFDHVPEARDFGFVMRNAVDIDLAASATAYREFHHSWRERIDIEADWLKAKRIDAVLTNVAYLPLAAANSAGLPSASLCSLNWADLFIHYFAGPSWAAKIYDEISTAYLNADCFLRVSPGLPMAYLDRRLEIGPIARLGRRNRRALSRRLGINESNRWILLAMGGIGFRLPVESWQRTPGFSWLAPGAWQVQREDVHAFDDSDLEFSDVLASVDAVITKPGYGTLVEAACNGIPILCMQRDDWPETPYFSAWLGEHARSRMLSRSHLMQGEFIDELTRLWEQPAPARPLPSGVEEAVELLQTALRLR
jgi:hypothetical protein